eukprot:2969972-Karenia_brevis.AAC.1
MSLQDMYKAGGMQDVVDPPPPPLPHPTIRKHRATRPIKAGSTTGCSSWAKRFHKLQGNAPGG